MFEEMNLNPEELNQDAPIQEQGDMAWDQEGAGQLQEGIDQAQEGQVLVETPVPETNDVAAEAQAEPDALDALMDGEDYVPDIGEMPEQVQPEGPLPNVQEAVEEQQIPEPSELTQEEEEAAHQELISGPVKRSAAKPTGEKAQTTRRPNARRQQAQDSRPQIWYINPEDRFNRELDENEKARVDIISAKLANERLVGVINNIEPPQKLQEAHAYITHGNYTVIIPANRIIPPRRDYRGEDPAEYRARQLNSRIGSEIEYLIAGEIDHKNHLAGGDRLKAMEQKCAQHWLRTNAQGLYILDAGALIEVRVVAVYRNGIVVEAFGLETFIPLSQLSYSRMADARRNFSTGTKAIAKVIEVNRTDPANVRIRLSLKQASNDTTPEKISRYTRGNRCVGVVSHIADFGIFVTLEGNVDCLCTSDPHFRPIIGKTVIVRIGTVDVARGRLRGRIEM